MKNQLDIEAARQEMIEKNQEKPKELYLLNETEKVRGLPNSLEKKREQIKNWKAEMAKGK
jgi:hypothetical protein